MTTPSRDPLDPLANERTPLIVPSHNGTKTADSQTSPQPSRPYKRVLTLLCIVLVLVQCGDELGQSPNTRIAEAIICYRHYEAADPTKLLIGRAAVGPGAIGGVSEISCKVGAVQSQLSTLRGYQGFLDGMPSLLLALPFGWAADKYGRKPFLVLGVLSFVLRVIWKQLVFWFWQSLDIRWSWASALHGLMAGSSPVVSALFFVIVSDIVPENERSKIFLRLGGVNLISAVSMPLFSAWLMEFTPWIPSFAGTFLTACAMPVALAMPETLGWSSSETREPMTGLEQEQEQEREQSSAATSQRTSPQSPTSSPAATLRHALAFLRADYRIPLLIASFLFHLAVIETPPLQLQYISTRYDLTIANATKLLTLRSIANLTPLFVLLPLLSKFLTQTWHLSGQRSDLYLSRLSMITWAIGWTLFGLAPTLLPATAAMGITALGSGSFFLIRAFLTPLVPEQNVAKLYSVISVVDTLGYMLGIPMLAALFNKGLAIGGYGVGLPFYVLGGMCTVVAVVLCGIGLRKGEEGTDGEDGGE